MPDWITIKGPEDLPEYREGEEWYFFTNSYSYMFGDAYNYRWMVAPSKCEDDWITTYVAYWPVPNPIGSRYPMIPPYTPPSGKDTR